MSTMAESVSNRIKALQSEVDRLTSASVRDAEIHASLRKRVEELEKFAVDMTREKLLHGPNPTLCSEARMLNLPAVREILDGAQDDETSPLKEARAEVTQLRALHAADDDMIAALQQQLSAETMRHYETAKRLEAVTSHAITLERAADAADGYLEANSGDSYLKQGFREAYESALASIKEPNS